MDTLNETELTNKIHRFMERKLDAYPELRTVPVKTPNVKKVKHHVPYKPYSFFSLGSTLYSLRSNQSLAK